MKTLTTTLLLMLTCIAASAVASTSLSSSPMQTVAYFADGAWLRHQAELGDPRFQFVLANKYFTSDQDLQIAQDYSKAYHWYKKAANQGYSDAAYNLAVMRVQGIGVDVDLVEGLAWLEVAASYGHKLSRELAAELRAIMSEERVSKAQALMLELVPRYRRYASDN